jgi:hypothetical protein
MNYLHAFEIEYFLFSIALLIHLSREHLFSSERRTATIRDEANFSIETPLLK